MLHNCNPENEAAAGKDIRTQIKKILQLLINFLIATCQFNDESLDAKAAVTSGGAGEQRAEFFSFESFYSLVSVKIFSFLISSAQEKKRR